MERVLARNLRSKRRLTSSRRAPVTSYLDRLHSRHANLADGAVATDTMVECHVLEADDFDALTVDHPALACILLINLLRAVGRTARRMTGEIALLAG